MLHDSLHYTYVLMSTQTLLRLCHMTRDGNRDRETVPVRALAIKCGVIRPARGRMRLRSEIAHPAHAMVMRRAMMRAGLGTRGLRGGWASVGVVVGDGVGG